MTAFLTVFWAVFWAVFRYRSEIPPGNSLNFPKKYINPNIDMWVPKMRFSKMYIFGVPIESEGSGMVSS